MEAWLVRIRWWSLPLCLLAFPFSPLSLGHCVYYFPVVSASATLGWGTFSAGPLLQ